ncbi:gp53-like domain-containing protein [Xanthomonas oryzae pv. oryzicola]|uniref:gp53-like domain-containing protein n=1 Tax=Xanthomonas oryzae TaxID=347 RepID=UPI00069A232C|nr:hypothetical protein [Xanthomonas oryzae]AVU02515.1 hypothetical protein C0L90_08645 [Xanthomonas oryzae pv. oryzae]OWB26872.1 hypothetical protein XocBAI21_17590 [Xanthomonas oryzae pv. oryzicola]QBI15717.1 hypothetical protein EYR03_08725 [Xanthomonas oryzae pv. oryzae]QBI15759.1 hypothetical protein EYR03_09005 [Xanthomonas oryzae pv. oryzae]QBN39005.1 hypothetical protein EBA04_08695 [Xanthomonas oryzae pv. oryzae]
MSQRFYNPAPVFADLLGLEPLAGGFLQFYDKGTTTSKGTWSDSDLTVANQNPVPLDSSGRANTNIWLDGAYTVVLRAADGTSVWTRDVDDSAAGGATIPSLQNGQFLSNDGSNLLWGEVLQVPDPTGSSGKILGTDGANLIWEAKPEIPDLPVENFSGAMKIGTAMIQWGTSTIAASGETVAAGNVNFPRAFSGAPVVTAQSNAAAVTNEGQIPVFAIASTNTTGFSVQVHTDDYGRNGSRISRAVPYSWIAIGPVA